MNKKLIALAVAGVVAAPMAAQAEATLYGQAHLSFDALDGASPAADYGVQSRASRVGVKGAEDLGGGLKAVYQMEFGVDMSGDTGTNWTARNQIVGLAGSWGTVAMGRHDTPYKMATGKLDVFVDTLADYNTVIMVDRRLPNVLAYLSPNMSGFNINAAIVTDEGTNTGNDPLASSLGATYENGPLFVAGAYENLTDTDGDGNDDSTAVKVGAGYSFGDFGVGFVYEDLAANEDDFSTSWVLNGKYTMGSNVLKASYGTIDWEAAGVDNTNQWAVGVDHNFSKSTTVYAVYTGFTDAVAISGQNNAYVGPDANGDLSGLSLGMVKKF